MKLPAILLFAVVTWSAHAQVAELKPSEILKLWPDRIEGLHPFEEFRSEQMKIGSITYTLAL
jgi:hypothetical protein